MTTRPDIIIGIDPGKKGAFAVCAVGRVVSVDDLPIHPVTNMIDPIALDYLLDERIWSARFGRLTSGDVGFLLEDPMAIASGGTKTARTIGKGEGLLYSAMVRFAHPLGEGWQGVRIVKPNAWKKKVGVTSDKETSLDLACRRFPHLAQRFARKKDDGRAEAALLAEFGYENWSDL